MKRKLLIIFIIFSLTIELVFVLSKFFSAGKNKSEITQKLSNVIGADVDIKGKVELKVFPIPNLVISHIRINNYNIGQYDLNIRSTKLIGSISIIKLLQGDIQFSKIVFDNARIEAKLSNKKSSQQKIHNVLTSELHLKNLLFTNSAIEITDKINKSSKKYHDLNINIMFNNEININGSFNSTTELFNLSAIIKMADKQNIHSDFNINFSDNNLTIHTESDQYGNTSGNAKIVGKDLQHFVFNNLLSLWFFYPDEKISNYEITLNFDINDNNINIKNGEIKGDSIEGYFIGEIKDNQTGNINVKFKQFDLDTLLTKKKKSYIIEEMDYRNLIEQTSNLPILLNENKITISGVLENVTVKNHQFGPIDFNILLDENKSPQIENLIFKITPEDIHHVSGILEQKQGRYHFKGEYQSNGSNINSLISNILPNTSLDPDIADSYELKATFNINTNFIKLNNITGKISKDSIIQGNVFLSFLDDENSMINLNANNLNFNNFLLINKKEQKRHMLHYIYQNLASRAQEDSLLRNLLWLRNLYATIAFNLNFQNTHYNDTIFKNISIAGNTAHREFKLNKFHLYSDDNNINIIADINLDEKRPYFNIDINATKANLDFLDYHKQNSETQYIWSKDLLYVPNFKNMDSELKARFSHLKYHELKFHDTNFSVTVENDIMDIKTISGKIGKEGDFNIQGNFILDGLPTLNLTYNFNKFSIGNYIKFFFNIPHFNAKANWAGTLYTSGNTPYILARQLQSKNTFYLADIKINQLAIPKIVQEIANLSSDPVNSFKTPLVKLIRDGDTKFKTANGTINIKNGNLIINNIKFNTSNLQGVVAGKINLVSFVMKLNSVFVFTAYYKVKSTIKKTALTITHNLEGKFDNITGKFNLFQLKSFVEQLKKQYIKLYDQLSNKNIEEQNTQNGLI